MQEQHQHQQQGGDASADKEVMAILSSPAQQKKFVVKPQPRPGGAIPASPAANGKAAFVPPSSAAALSGDLRDATAALPGGRCGAVEAVVGGGGGGGGIGAVDATGLAAPSPPQTPRLPKPPSASWDPHVQSSSSAFSVPAGRGGGGGMAEGSGGVGAGGGGGGGGVCSAGIGSMSLGGFRSVGGGPFQVWVRS